MTSPDPLIRMEHTPHHDEASEAASESPESPDDSLALPDDALPAAIVPSVEAYETTATPVEHLNSVSDSVMASLKMALMPTLAFVLVGLLLGLRVAAQATLPHIFQPGDYVNYQNVLDGLPVPRLLAWNTEQVDFLAALRDLSGVTLPLIVLFVLGPLWLIIVRRVNPTFRLISHAPTSQSSATVSEPAEPADSPLPAENSSPARLSASAALSTPLEFYGLIKALTLLVALGMPLAAVWILVDWEDVGSTAGSASLASSNAPLIGSVWALRLMLMALAFWVGFHRDGIAGDFTHPQWNSSRRKLPALALRGACFGLLAFVACRLGLPQHLEEILLRLQTLGCFSMLAWRQITWHILLSFGLVWLALGILFAFLSPPANHRTKPALLLLPVAACLLAAWFQQRITPQTLAAHYDIRPAVLQAIPDNMTYRPDVSASGIPDGIEAGRELARQLHVPDTSATKPAGRTLVLFTQPQPLLAFQNNITTDGFTPDAKFVTQTTQFLRDRDYQSALSWVAIKNLFNVPLMRFDTTGAIRVGLQDLTHTPHNAQFAPTVEQMFAICAATPENLALLDQWADESRFAFPDRESRRLMGDLYRRMGSIPQALRWYRKADMPASFLQRVGAERPMYSAGTIHGLLRWNGKPLVGAQVAVVPALMNGLPVGLEAQVREAQKDMLNFMPRANPDLFPAYHPYPWLFRLISASATTDINGAYRIEHLTEGTYNAICTLPDGIQTTLPLDNRLSILNPIPNFNLNYGQTGYDMGTTEFQWKAIKDE